MSILSAERCSLELISNVLQAGSCVPQVEVLLRFRRVSSLITDQNLTTTEVFGMRRFQSAAFLRMQVGTFGPWHHRSYTSGPEQEVW
jgi:hypothetical protein